MKETQKRNIFCFFAVYVIVYVLYAKILSEFVMISAKANVMIQLINYIVLGIWGILIFRSELKDGLKAWRDNGMKSLLWLMGGYVLDMVIRPIFFMPLYYYSPDYEGLNDKGVADLISNYPDALLLLGLGILGPVTEEVIFRLCPVMRWGKRIPSLIVILVPSILFMLIHLHTFTLAELLYNLPQLATGLVYGIILLKSRNATIPVLLHVLNNTFAILTMMIR